MDATNITACYKAIDSIDRDVAALEKLLENEGGLDSLVIRNLTEEEKATVVAFLIDFHNGKRTARIAELKTLTSDALAELSKNG